MPDGRNFRLRELTPGSPTKWGYSKAAPEILTAAAPCGLSLGDISDNRGADDNAKAC
jgi:hypothetical protein